VTAVRKRSPPKPWKTPIGIAVLTRHEFADGLEADRRDSDPPRPARLRDDPRDAPALPRLVEVAPDELLEIAERMPVASSTRSGSR
jgi:hypothetical protein